MAEPDPKGFRHVRAVLPDPKGFRHVRACLLEESHG